MGLSRDDGDVGSTGLPMRLPIGFDTVIGHLRGLPGQVNDELGLMRGGIRLQTVGIWALRDCSAWGTSVEVDGFQRPGLFDQCSAPTPTIGDLAGYEANRQPKKRCQTENEDGRHEESSSRGLAAPR